jgi:hypothetical protein
MNISKQIVGLLLLAWAIALLAGLSFGFNLPLFLMLFGTVLVIWL